jgi:tetratricopeptide (TPR) repeat protein
MATGLDPSLRECILQKLRTFDRKQILEAVALSDGFPPPSLEHADEVAQVLHDIGLYAESLGDWDLCATLYQRVVQYPVFNAQIPAGSSYRYGLCQERRGKLREAARAYRRTLEYGEVWPEVNALARRNLARLLVAAEEYEEAAAVLAQLLKAPLIPGIEAVEIQLSLARCLLRLARYEEALALLEPLSKSPNPGEFPVEAMCLLAEVHEAKGDFQSAARCYSEIAASGLAETHIKAAAIHRQSALRKR